MRALFQFIISSVINIPMATYTMCQRELEQGSSESGKNSFYS